MFRIDRDKLPISAPTLPGDPPFSRSPAVCSARTALKLEINGEPLPGWNLSFGGILLDSQFVNSPFVGGTPAGAADWQAGLFSGYELQGGSLRGLGAGVGLFAIGDRGVSVFSPGGTLDGYERVDLSVFYNGIRNTSIAFQVRNIFDEVYVEGADRPNFAQFGSPTAALLTVRYEFGD